LKEEVRIRVEAVKMAHGIKAETVGAVMDSGKQVDKGGCIRNLFSEGNNFGKELHMCIVEETTECGAVDVSRMWK